MHGDEDDLDDLRTTMRDEHLMTGEKARQPILRRKETQALETGEVGKTEVRLICLTERQKGSTRFVLARIEV